MQYVAHLPTLANAFQQLNVPFGDDHLFRELSDVI